MIYKLISGLFKKKSQKTPPEKVVTNFRRKYTSFKTILESNSELLKIISDIEEKLNGDQIFGSSFIRSHTTRIIFHTARMIKAFEELSGRPYPHLTKALTTIHDKIKTEVEHKNVPKISEFIMPYSKISKDMIDDVGGKNANLGEVCSQVHLPIPKGFAITTTAFDAFLKANDLSDEIQKQKMLLKPNDPESFIEVSENIQRLFLTAKVPKDIEAAIYDAYQRYVDHRGVSGGVKIALRSSAIGEDSDLSFAGQYLSIMNVPPDKIIRAYQKVLASLFTPRAISYRLHMGIPFEEASMSVACLEMIQAKAGGVMYTRHPFNLTENHIIINAVWGLGVFVVDGVIPPDTYILSKDSDPKLLESIISNKTKCLINRPDGYVMETDVAPEKQHLPCLSPDQAQTLGRYGLALENHYKCPQDIEWVLDHNDSLFILQTRPLRLDMQPDSTSKSIQSPPIQGYPILIESGSIACPGIGYGMAFHIESEDDLNKFPQDGVLITAHSSPQYVIVMEKAAAIVTNYGSITGHMASVAREFRVPSLLNTKIATSKIPHGAFITVDAYAARVYLGKVTELIDLKIERGTFMKDTPVYNSLKRIAEHIVPLHLVDPKSPDFHQKNCKTVHDIMRFIHELSYGEIFKISDYTTDEANIAVKLDAPLPIDLYVIDLGNGLSNHSNSKKIRPDQVISIPFKSLLSGMLHKGLQNIEPKPVNIGGFLSVMTQQMLSPPNYDIERFGDKSYAIISDKYTNFSSRVGYHYSVLDAYCDQTYTKNYINFEFKGGAADDIRRNRRARLIKNILQHMNFLVEVQGDRVTARFAKQPIELITEKLDILGRLLIYTRQMDMLMNSETNVQQLTECFLKEDYNINLSS